MGHKLLLQMTRPFFFQQGDQGIWEHLQPTPAVTPAPWGVQGGQDCGGGGALKHQTAGSSFIASPETSLGHALHF